MAWCIRVGGASAIARAFARLAAIAAAILDFLGAVVVDVLRIGKAVCELFGFGQALASVF